MRVRENGIDPGVFYTPLTVVGYALPFVPMTSAVGPAQLMATKLGYERVSSRALHGVASSRLGKLRKDRNEAIRTKVGLRYFLLSQRKEIQFKSFANNVGTWNGRTTRV